MAASLTLAQAWRVAEAVCRLAGTCRVPTIAGQRRTALDIAARRASNELGVQHLAAMPAPQPIASGPASVEAALAGQTSFPPLFPSAAGGGTERHS